MGCVGAERDAFLPLSPADLRRRGRGRPDVVLVTGDAYVDHPSFGAAQIGRLLEAEGFSVALLSRPRWQGPGDFLRYGRPRLFVGVTAGNLDSLVANRNAWRRPRRRDDYAPGGLAGGRPDRAALVYAQRCRQAWSDVPLILGGLEASLRRLAHYDWWTGRVRRSLLLDARADLLVYGMGERAVVEAARRLAGGSDLAGIPGTALALPPDRAPAGRELPSFEQVRDDPEAFLRAQCILEEESRAGGAVLLQSGGAPNRVVVHYPPPPPASPAELDRWAELPFTRRAHPEHEREGGVPALAVVRDSITGHRGCLGDCSFCALSLHQGRWIASRSAASIEREAARILDLTGKGRLSDIGGPAANMYGLTCPRLAAGDPCRDRDCLVPEPCPRLAPGGSRAWLELLRRIRNLPGLERVEVGSGPRYDLLDRPALEELCRHHVGGQLKVAPEHCGRHALHRMNKPEWRRYEEFRRLFAEVNRRLGREQFLTDYFLAAHPGTTLAEAVELFDRLSRVGRSPEQAQLFLPLPMTRSAAMFHTGRDPRDGEAVAVAREEGERRMHLALIQWRQPWAVKHVRRALEICGRRDLLRRLGRKGPGRRR